MSLHQTYEKARVDRSWAKEILREIKRPWIIRAIWIEFKASSFRAKDKNKTESKDFGNIRANLHITILKASQESAPVTSQAARVLF